MQHCARHNQEIRNNQNTKRISIVKNIPDKHNPHGKPKKETPICGRGKGTIWSGGDIMGEVDGRIHGTFKYCKH